MDSKSQSEVIRKEQSFSNLQAYKGLDHQKVSDNEKHSLKIKVADLQVNLQKDKITKISSEASNKQGDLVQAETKISNAEATLNDFSGLETDIGMHGVGNSKNQDIIVQQALAQETIRKYEAEMNNFEVRFNAELDKLESSKQEFKDKQAYLNQVQNLDLTSNATADIDFARIADTNNEKVAKEDLDRNQAFLNRGLGFEDTDMIRKLQY
jgi:hypothetical protein